MLGNVSNFVSKEAEDISGGDTAVQRQYVWHMHLNKNSLNQWGNALWSLVHVFSHEAMKAKQQQDAMVFN